MAGELTAAVDIDPDRPVDPVVAAAAAAAPSAPIAVAGRAFGDDYPALASPMKYRAAGILLMIVTAFYVPWMLQNLNGSIAWFAWLFAAANLFSVGYSLLAIVNGWQRRVPIRRVTPPGKEPQVAVVIPTCGEPLPMVLRTVVSVLEQDWPRDRLTVVVSDDGHDPELAAALADLPVSYYEPPPLWSPGRDGAAKAGNLNAAVAMLDEAHPEIRYLETRDADDELGTHQFLRHVIGQLEHDDGLAFVQTIKEAQVSAGDPFNNRESMFYRGQMLSRNAANAVFPCGSGLAWRRTALHEIGGFPTWNLVEDVQSGVEALKGGWRGMYIPILGAVGQHAPEDVPSYYKQRGTWAIDTARLVIWGRLRGLGLRQKLQFWEMLAFYLNGFTAFVYIASILASLLGVPPLTAGALDYLIHLGPYAVAVEIWLLVHNAPYNDRRGRQRGPFRALWRTRVMWTGMAPVYTRAVLLAIAGGPNRKPVYTVTRKQDDFRWHWRHALPQTTLVGLVVTVAVYGLVNETLPSLALLAGAAYWGGLQVALLTNFIVRSWYGIERRAREAGLPRLPDAEPVAVVAPPA
jgi:cellulose synthase (UDP-forming)